MFNSFIKGKLIYKFYHRRVYTNSCFDEQFNWKSKHFVVQKEKLDKTDVVYTFAYILKKDFFNNLIFVVV